MPCLTFGVEEIVESSAFAYRHVSLSIIVGYSSCQQKDGTLQKCTPWKGIQSAICYKKPFWKRIHTLLAEHLNANFKLQFIYICIFYLFFFSGDMSCDLYKWMKANVNVQ